MILLTAYHSSPARHNPMRSPNSSIAMCVAS